MPRKSTASVPQAPPADPAPSDAMLSPLYPPDTDTSLLSIATDASATTAKTPKSTSKAEKDSDTLGIDDLLLPRTLTSRLARGTLPPNTSLQRDALLALTKAASVFISYLASHANEITTKKTITSQDVLRAVREVELGGVMGLDTIGKDGLPGGRLEREVEMWEGVVRGKRRGYRDKLKEKEKEKEKESGEGLDRDGEPEAKRQRMATVTPNHLEARTAAAVELNGVGGQRTTTNGGPVVGVSSGSGAWHLSHPSLAQTQAQTLPHPSPPRVQDSMHHAVNQRTPNDDDDDETQPDEDDEDEDDDGGEGGEDDDDDDDDDDDEAEDDEDEDEDEDENVRNGTAEGRSGPGAQLWHDMNSHEEEDDEDDEDDDDDGNEDEETD